MRPRQTLAALAVVTGLLAAGCADRGGSEGNQAPGAPNTSAATADFGDLKNVCGPGDPVGAPAQGVTADEIQVGVLSDVGFSKNPEFGDAAKVFTSWCNAAGGINGRKVVGTVRDTKFVEVRQRVLDACRDDFALVGGGAGLDHLGVRDRLECLLPEFPGQVIKLENEGSDLQFSVQPGGPSYLRNAAFYDWLLREAYPESGSAVGVLVGDSIKSSGDQRIEFARAWGANVVYSDLFPASGVSNWVPYAQAIKSKGVKGLIYMGDFRALAKLEKELTTLDYKLDWIDTNVNAYGPEFVQLAGSQVLAEQNNLADLSGIHPVDDGPSPATRQLVDLFAEYAPGAKVSIGAVKAFSAWLLFAQSASACGEDLTRKCVVEQARTQTAWTGGGLQAPRDLSAPDTPSTCFNVVKATAEGWKSVDVKANQDGFRCGAASYKLTGSYGKPLTLADVGKSLDDLK
ncbi:ABC transporter substrate-binding protein [Yinghuangia sp. ASG 101]|uniref:ABC transporter substrate-binding protein n=1 Tax=Yinghuangia sp. ASG 101 TaxID=2896848 RepID=UPI001E395B36|nr:ABC transporter substrate-binding protein [Yinghuangia sp. ASG 101]UGQ12473.1 ABC transporter substrate-binding protein [Yinghuangia sp. ASG 101]